MPLLKHLPEDFMVEEISIVPEFKPGPYHYLCLSKKSYPTMKACQIIADFLHLPLSAVGFAGNKDKMAVTKQLISIKTTRDLTSLLERFKTGDIALEYIGAGEEPVVMGHLRGNRFVIVVRRFTQQPQALTRFINLFGDQRFSKNNSEIGKLLIKQQFKEALALIDNPIAHHYLEEHPANAVDALRQIPKQLLKIYVHAYQSMLFNKTITQFLDGKKSDGVENQMVQLIGFGYECENAEIDAIIKKLLDKEGITGRDFIIRALPDISCEGGERALFADVHDLEIGPLEDDEFHSGTKKCTLKFWLDKGCYATEAVKQMFS